MLACSYIKIRNINEEAPRTKKDRERGSRLAEVLREYENNVITRGSYVKAVAYKHLPQNDVWLIWETLDVIFACNEY